MRNAVNWRPSKYVTHRDRLRGARDNAEVAIGSRLLADLNAEVFSRLLPRFVTGRLLELGCGKAPLYGVYREFASDVICADWPASKHGNDYVDVTCDVGRGLPFRDGVFDTVLASDVLEHVYEARALIAEIARVLKLGGHIIINTPFMYKLHEIPHDYHRFTAFSLKRMLVEAGLECVLVEPCGDAGVVVADVVGKCSARVPLVGKFVAAAFQHFMFRLWNQRRNELSAFPISHFAVGVKLRDLPSHEALVARI
jgi:SAM-dependent methyltransferase